MQQLLTHFSLRLLNKLALESPLGVFVPHPLLVIHLGLERDALWFSVLFRIDVVCSVRPHFTLSVHTFKFILVDLQSILKNLTNRDVLGVCRIRLLIDEPVHVIISCLVCLFNFVVQKLAVVAAKPAMPTPHSNDFVYHVESVLWEFTTFVLVAYQRLWVLVLCSFLVKQRVRLASA